MLNGLRCRFLVKFKTVHRKGNSIGALEKAMIIVGILDVLVDIKRNSRSLENIYKKKKKNPEIPADLSARRRIIIWAIDLSTRGSDHLGDESFTQDLILGTDKRVPYIYPLRLIFLFEQRVFIIMYGRYIH